MPDTEDVVCQHGVAMDVHCCNCHSGFQFDPVYCVCDDRILPDKGDDENV